jgi:hypothetical protein
MKIPPACVLFAAVPGGHTGAFEFLARAIVCRCATGSFIVQAQ